MSPSEMRALRAQVAEQFSRERGQTVRFASGGWRRRQRHKGVVSFAPVSRSSELELNRRLAAALESAIAGPAVAESASASPEADVPVPPEAGPESLAPPEPQATPEPAATPDPAATPKPNWRVNPSDSRAPASPRSPGLQRPDLDLMRARAAVAKEAAKEYGLKVFRDQEKWRVYKDAGGKLTFPELAAELAEDLESRVNKLLPGTESENSGQTESNGSNGNGSSGAGTPSPQNPPGTQPGASPGGNSGGRNSGGGNSGGGNSGGGNSGGGNRGGQRGPVITSLGKRRVQIGEPVSVYGKHLAGTTSVQVGGVEATILDAGPSYVIIEVHQATSGRVTVTTPHGTATSFHPLAVEAANEENARGNGSGAGGQGGGGRNGGDRSGERGGDGLLQRIAGQLAINNILGQGSPLRGAVSSIIDGASSIAERAFSVGRDIGGALLGGFLSPFGRTGTAVGNVAQSGLGAAQGVMGAGVNIAGSVLGTGAQVVGGVASAGLSIGGMLLGFGGGAILGTMIGALIAPLTSLLTTLASEVGRAFGEMGKAAVAAINAVVEILQDTLQTAREYGDSIRRLNAVGGLDSGRAGNLLQSLSMFGFKPAEVSQMFGSPMARLTSEIGAGVAGLPNPEADPFAFMRAGARRLEDARAGGIGGLMAFQAQLSVLPGGAEAYLDKFSLGEDTIARIQRVNDVLHISPETLEQLSKDMAVADALFSGFATKLKVVFAQNLMPLLGPLLEGAIGYLEENKNNLIDIMFNLGVFFAITLPRMLVRGLSGLMNVLGDWMLGFGKSLQLFGQGSDSWLNIIGTILKGVDLLSVGFRAMAMVVGLFVTTLENFGIMLWNIFATVSKVMTWASDTLSTILKKVPDSVLGAIPGIGAQLVKNKNAVTDALDNMPGLEFMSFTMFDPNNAYNQAAAIGTTDAYGEWENWQNSQGPRDLGSSLMSGGQTLKDRAKDVEGYGKTLDQNESKILKTLEDLRDHAKGTKENTRETAENTRRTAEHTRFGPEVIAQMVARVLAYASEDAGLNLMRG